MNTKTPQVLSLTAGALWSLMGLLAGLALGIAFDIPSRVVVLFAALGLAVGWFGFTGTYGRLNGKEKSPVGAAAQPSAPKVQAQPAAAPFRVEDHIFSPEEARQWLDDFLVKQQRK